MKMTEFDKMGVPMVMDTPTVMIEGQQYKIGFTGLVFVQRNGDWRRTDNVTAADVRDYIDLQKRDKRNRDAEQPKELTPYMIKKISADGKKARGKL